MASRQPVETAVLQSMIATIPHRGPDASGVSIYEKGGVGLAHTRLSILDLHPHSNQPFEIDDGTLSVVFNGEIFNYIELRKELEGLGHSFRTTSDTEVLIHAYKQWGESAVTRFNGMWAFAIHDRARRVLFCSRDRFGIKPFQYAVHGGRFLFASEAKAILAASPDLAKPDYGALSAILRTSMSGRCERTCFDGIRRLLPAHNMVVTRDGVRISRYWDYPTDMDRRISAEDAAAELRGLLVDSIRLRMRSDVPVGTTLSAGVDSSSIVCLLRTFYDGPHETFTASFPSDPFDEGPTAEWLSRRLGMSPNLVPAGTDDFLERMRQVIHHLEIPNQSPAVFPLWNIMRLARTKVTVTLEGQGADELLGGYLNACMAPIILDRLRRLHPWDAARQYALIARTYGVTLPALWLARGLAPWTHGPFRRFRGDEAVYAGALREAREDELLIRRTDRLGDGLTTKLRAQHEGTLVDLLQYGDAISMAHSIESRLPFMDYRLVEFVFRLPGRLKFRDGRGKAVLLDAVRRDVPERILAERRKRGFSTPVSRWFRDDPERTVYPVLRSRACRERGLFDRDCLERALRRHIEGKFDLGNHIFRWISTELWFQHFIDGAVEAPKPGGRAGEPAAAAAS